MRRIAVLAVLALAACGDGLSEEEKAAQDAADVAAVRALNGADAPPQPIAPQVIGYPVIEEYELFGAGCAFAPGSSMGTVMVAMDDTAYLLVEDEIERMAADMGSAELPLGTRAQYHGTQYSVAIEFDESKATQGGLETTNYPGSITIRDAGGQVVYAESGTIQCGV